MMGGDKIVPKSCFDCVQSIESVYTGGCVAISKDEQRIFTTCNEDISVLDMSTGRRIAELKGDTELVTAFAVKPNGKHLVSASRSTQLAIWNLETFKTERSFKAHESMVISMDIDSTSTLVATGFADGTVRVWDIDRGYCTHNFKGHGGPIAKVRFYPLSNDLKLVSASDAGDIRVWDLKQRKSQVLDAHMSVVRAIDFDETGEFMVTAGRDSVINVWNWKRKSLIRTIPVYEAIEAAGVLQTPELGSQRVIYSGGEKGIIRLWDMNTGEELFSQTKEHNAKHAFINTLYLPQSRLLCAATNDQNLLFYSADEQLKRVRQIVGYNEEVIDMAFIGQEQKHLAVATNTEQLRIYNTSNHHCELAYGHKDIILALDVHDNGAIVATGSKDNTACVWAINMSAPVDQRVTCIAIAVGHTKAVGAVRLARGLDSLFMISGSEDRTVKRWDLEPLRDVFQDPSCAIDFVSESGPIKLQSQYTFQAHEKDINSIKIAPGNKLFATGSQDKTAKVWDVATGKPLGTLQGHRRGVWNIALSPTDRVIATASSDHTIKLWSLTDFSCLKTFEGHTSSVLCVEFVSMGTQLLSTGSDGLIKLWSIKDSECVVTLDKHEGKIWTLAKSTSEEYLATGGADSVIHIWKDTTQEELERLHTEEAQTLEQQQQLDNYLLVKDYRNAISLALSLNQPHRLLTIFQDVMMAAENRHGEEGSGNEPSAVLGNAAIDKVVGTLAPEQLEHLLSYIRSWNTNGRFARVAQAALYCILTQYPAQTILALPSAKDLIASLQPYSERHFSRLDGLLTGSFIVDYTLHAMDAIADDSMDMD
ncbi:WD40-repeat-containing domain protein [Coemansia mojavensis]|nr:WD40-repeat-containing domain protein [Coemansia mojavensis]